MFAVMHCDMHPFAEVFLSEVKSDGRYLFVSVEFDVLEPLFALQLCSQLVK